MITILPKQPVLKRFVTRVKPSRARLIIYFYYKLFAPPPPLPPFAIFDTSVIFFKIIETIYRSLASELANTNLNAWKMIYHNARVYNRALFHCWLNRNLDVRTCVYKSAPSFYSSDSSHWIANAFSYSARHLFIFFFSSVRYFSASIPHICTYVTRVTMIVTMELWRKNFDVTTTSRITRTSFVFVYLFI